MNADIAGPAHKIVHDRAVQNLKPARAGRFSDDDLGDVVGVRVANHVVGNAPIAARDRDRFAAERFRQTQRVGNAIALLFAELQAAPAFDVERDPRRMQPVRQPLGVAHKTRRARILADADQNAFAGGPWARRWRPACICVSSCSSTRSAVRRSASSRSAVRLAGEKKCSKRPLGLLRDVDLSFLEPLDQIVGREIDQFDGVGAIEHGIRHGLAHADMRDLSDDVVQAFDVLDIDGGVDVDAVAQQLFDVEIALGMAAAGRVGVGKFVDQHDLRPAGDDGVEVHLLEPLALVFDAPARDDFEALQQRLGLLAAVGLDDADDNVVAVFLPGAGLLQHLVGLADAGRRTHEDLELADAAFLAPRRLEQGLRRGSLFEVATLICHRPSDPEARPEARPRLLRCRLVERQIERQHVHARLAEQAEEAALGVLADELAHAIFRHVARLRNTRHLEQRGLRRDVRIEAAARRRHQIDRNRRGRDSPS